VPSDSVILYAKHLYKFELINYVTKVYFLQKTLIVQGNKSFLIIDFVYDNNSTTSFS
jgi:hypothetical protein